MNEKDYVYSKVLLNSIMSFGYIIGISFLSILTNIFSEPQENTFTMEEFLQNVMMVSFFMCPMIIYNFVMFFASRKKLTFSKRINILVVPCILTLLTAVFLQEIISSI